MQRHQQPSAVILGGLAVALALTVVTTTVVGVVTTYSPLPYWDQWGEATVAQHLDLLLTPHNEHRILFPRLIFIADKLWFGGNNKLDLTLILLVQLVHACLLIILLSRARRMSAVENASAAAIALSLLFWMYQSENFTWGFQVQFVGVFAAATGAFLTLALGSGFRGPAGSA
jgi:hypothetical protein